MHELIAQCVKQADPIIWVYFVTMLMLFSFMPKQTSVFFPLFLSFCRDEECAFLHQKLRELYEVNRDSNVRGEGKKSASSFLRMCEAVEALNFFTLKFWHSTNYICLKSRQCSSVQLVFSFSLYIYFFSFAQSLLPMYIFSFYM